MVQERKCILCQIVYNTKKEMDEHMRSMLHHRELENLKGRDSNHECLVCKVKVVGLSAYAKHISSQLHKDNTEIQDTEEGKEDAAEEYFDQELIQLIKQRDEQNRADETCHSKHETDGKRRHENRTSYPDRDAYDSSSRYYHGQRDWKWENSRHSKFTHFERLPNNKSRHLSSQKSRPGWHRNNSGESFNQYNCGNARDVWHQNSGGGTSSWHHSSRGRSPNWNSEDKNCFSNWQSNKSPGDRHSGHQSGSGWNLGRNRAGNNSSQMDYVDTSWSKNKSKQDKYSRETYKWQWQRNSSVTSYTDLANETDDMNYLLDFTSDELPPDWLLKVGVFEQPNSNTSKVNRRCSSPSREKTNRWSPYPSQKTIEQQPLPDKTRTKISEQAHAAHRSSSQLSKKCAKTSNSKGKKWDETNEVPSNSKVVSRKHVSSKGPTERTSEKKSDQGESKGNRMPSVKSPLLAMPDMKSSSQKRSPKNHLKDVQRLLSSSSEECQSQLNVDASSSSSYGSRLSHKYDRDNLRGIRNVHDDNESLNEVLQKAKEDVLFSHALQNSRSSSCRDKQTDKNEEQNIEGSAHSLKMLDPQIDGLEENCGETVGNKCIPSSPCLSLESSELDHTATRKDNCLGELGNTDQHESQMDTISNCQPNEDVDLKASLEEDGEENAIKLNHHPREEDYDVHLNHDLQKGVGGQPVGPLLPGLPASLQRDLTWRTSLKSKTGSHLPEPNLNSARRIRNVTGHRKNETEKDSGLKPTLRQIISVSRRNINWEHVIQQVTKKKQELGKGLPRFGIEMVPLIQNEKENLDLGEDSDLTNLEGFHWEGISIGSPGTIRKRSLSESSVAVDKTASVYNFFSNQGTSKESDQRQIGSFAVTKDASSQMHEDVVASVKQESTSLLSSPLMSSGIDSVANGRRLSLQIPPDVDRITVFSPQGSQRSPEYRIQLVESQDFMEGPGEGNRTDLALAASSVQDAATDSSYTSGNEQNDNQGIGKKRRATGEECSPEIPSLESKNKRRKIKGKKERSQVDQLLSISLKEEELSKSLHCVDGNLLQARAALQAAYIEVQRLLVLKQQMSVEMSTLRSQRIQILQGLQETYEPPEQPQQPHPNGSSEKRNGKLQPAQNPPANPDVLVPLLQSASSLFAQIPPARLTAPVRVSTPPTFQSTSGTGALTVPDSSVQIKQEPASPTHGDENTNVPVQSSQCFQHAELQFQDGNEKDTFSQYPVISAVISVSGLTDLQQPDDNVENSAPEKRRANLSGYSFSKCSLLTVATEETKSPADSGISEQHSSSSQNRNFSSKMPEDEDPMTEQLEQIAVSSESKVNKKKKKKKKLKKKKALRATHVPENSDTEQDISDSKPLRKVKLLKVPTVAKVTTSTPPKHEGGEESTGKQDESDTSVEFVEVTKSPLDVVPVGSSESGDEIADSPSKRDAFSPSEQVLKEESRSGYDEVSSTSEIGTNYKDGIGRSVAETQTSISSIRISKNSSEVSSEPGEDDEATEGVFEGHSAAVNAIQIFGNLLYTCSADKTIRAYSLVNRKCVGVFRGHTSKVNCLLVTQTTGKSAALYSGSSDHNINCYNIKTKELVDQFKLDDRVLCLHSRWRILYAGLANGNVVTLSIKSNRQVDTFECHGPRAISCLATAQEGARKLLIVGSYDCTISVRDAQNGLLLRTLEGHSKTVLCMKVVNDLVFSGSSDQSVHAHNIHTGELVRIYKGHNHAVTVVNILGKVMVTACLDKFVRVYELQSHDRLQVYGGHSDMIMCMTIHKSMIYTGCYDGSIQAVRLNLMQNYRCWWHGCSLIFGVMDHLKQHLLNDHTNPNFQTLKCRWKNCDAFFTSRKSSKHGAVGHIEKHAEDDSKIDS